MSHVRTQIRDAVAALLPGTVTVLKARAYPIDAASLPAALVYVGAERVQRGGFEALDRVVEVTVECLAKGSDVDERVDDVLTAVEQSVTGQTLGGLTVPLIPTRIDFDVSTEGSAPIGRARLTYEATYRTSLTDPETRI